MFACNLAINGHHAKKNTNFTIYFFRAMRSCIRCGDRPGAGTSTTISNKGAISVAATMGPGSYNHGAYGEAAHGACLIGHTRERLLRDTSSRT